MSDPRVILLVETSTSWGREIIRGILKYASEHGPWQLDFRPLGRHEGTHLPPDWRGNGIIARVTDRHLAEEIIASRLPAVNVSWCSFGTPEIVRCTSDEVRLGQMAADYLMHRGYRQFAYCGPDTHLRPGYIDRVGEQFMGILAKAGYACCVSEVAVMGNQDQEEERLGAWLKSLPRPLAVLTWNDAIGRTVAAAGRRAGLGVPGDVAILSAEYDELTNSMSSPPISTIDYRSDMVGYQAAALLHRLMRHEPVAAEPVLIEPLGIVARQSTDMVAVSDALIAEVLEFIQEHAARPLRVGHILKHFKVSRRALEERFRKTLGVSLAQEIRFIRLDRVKQMLVETREPVVSIAKTCGFLHSEVLTRNFRREYGISPTEYRKQYRLHR